MSQAETSDKNNEWKSNTRTQAGKKHNKKSTSSATIRDNVPHDAIRALPDGLDEGVPHRALKTCSEDIEWAGDEGLGHAPTRAPRNTRQSCV